MGLFDAILWREGVRSSALGTSLGSRDGIVLYKEDGSLLCLNDGRAERESVGSMLNGAKLFCVVA